MSTQKNKDNKVKLSSEFNLSEDFPVPSYEDWKSSAEKLLKGQSFEKKLITKTYEGIDLDPIYTKKDIKNLTFINSQPGEDNFLRGTDSHGYQKNNWDICQGIKADSLKEFNTKLKEALDRGQTAIYLDIDFLEINDQKKMAEVLSDIDLDKYPIYFKTGFSSLKTLNILVEYAKKNGFCLSEIKGSIETDPIADLAEFGTLPKSLENIYEDMAKSVKLASQELPGLKTIGINGSLFHNGGADSVTELSVSLGTAVEYLTEMRSRGININDAAKQISFTIGIGTNFFMEIAKLRSIRFLWQKIVEEFGGNKDAQKAHIHAKTSSYYLTKLDPFVNTLRTTTEAFSAVLGGADVITTNTYDDVLGENSDLSMRIARNTQIILKEESNLKRLIDPAGGSYYVETLTSNIIEKVWAEFQNIEKNGGVLESLKKGYVQDKIEETVSIRNKNVFNRKSVIVGTNMFVNPEDKVPETDKKRDENIKNKTGDLSIKKLNLSRLSEPFEEMRKLVFKYSERTNLKPKVFLANFGEVKQYKGRADFSRGLFEVGGFEIIYSEGFSNIEEMVFATITSNADIAVLCSDDNSYPEFVEVYIQSLRKQDRDISIILAGFPGKNEEQYRKWGIDDFIFMGSNVYAVLESLLKKTGVK